MKTENSTNKSEENARGRSNNRIQNYKTIWNQVWEHKEHNRNAEWINNMKKELQGLEEGPKADMYLYLLKAKL